jgi:hypothetical protein
MNAGNRNRKHGRDGRIERVVLRAVLVLGLAGALGLWYAGRGAGAGAPQWLPGLMGVAVAGGVTWFGRVRARERWEAAWDAYAAFDHEDRRLTPADEDRNAGLCLAAGR